jgi:threonine dehydrogenase-like Zn-dependent dehydrogenase
VLGGLVLIFCSTTGMFCSMRREGRRRVAPDLTVELTEKSELTSPLTVLVVGQGNVGLPLAMRSVEVGHRVVGFDTDARRIRRLGAGDSYVDDGVGQLGQRARHGTLRADQ